MGRLFFRLIDEVDKKTIDASLFKTEHYFKFTVQTEM